MKNITNQKIDISELFERYMIYICSSYKGYEFEDQLKSARRFIRDFYPNKKLIKNKFDDIFSRPEDFVLNPKSYYDLELKLSIRGF